MLNVKRILGQWRGPLARLIIILCLVSTTVTVPGAPAPGHKALAAAATMPSVSLAVNKPLAKPGETLTYTVTLSGQPGQADQTVSLAAPIPAGATYVASSVTGGASHNSSSGKVEWSGIVTASTGSVPSKVFTYQATVNGTATAGNVVATAILTSGSDLNTASATTNIDTSFPTITNNVDRATAAAGETLEYTIVVSGVSGQRDASITLTDELPANVTYVASSATGGISYNSGSRTIQWSGTITAPGGSVPSNIFTFRVTVNSGVTAGAVTNVASISDGTNVSSAAATTAIGSTPSSSLSATGPTISNAVNRTAASAGGELQYTVTIAGQPGMPDTSVVMTDTLPANVTYVASSVTGSGASYDSGSRQIRWSGTVTAGGGSLPSKVITFKVTVNNGVVAGTVGNVAVMSSGSNLTASRITTSVVEGLSSLSKSVSQESVRPGDTVQYTITLGGQASQSDTAISLLDTIPANADYVTGSVSGGATYNSSQRRIEWSGTMTASGGSLPSKVITFQVTLKSGVTTGNLVNVAQISDGTNYRTTKIVSNLQTTLPTITKVADRSIATPGQTVEYTITLAGYSGMADTSVILTDPIPSNTTYVASSVTGGATYNSSSNRIEWSGVVTAPSGSLPSRVITFRVTVGSGVTCGNITNTATITDGTSTTTASAVVAVDTAFPSFSKSANKTTVTVAEDTLQYTITMSGRTGACDVYATLADAIPANTTYVAGSVTGGASYNSAAGRIDWAGYVTPPGGSLPSKIITFSVRINAGVTSASIVNTATLTDGAATVTQTTTTPVSVSAPADTTAPSIIGGPTATPSTNSAVISWSTNEASTSIVQYGTTSALGTTSSDSTLVTSHSVTLSDLAHSTTYYYRVGSTDSGGNGPTQSTILQFTTLTPADTTAPVITGLPTAISPGYNSVVIEWATNEASTSLVYYGTSSSALSLTASDVALVTAHSVSLTGLSASTTYYFRVGSTDAQGNGPTYSPSATSSLSFATTAAPDTAAPVITSAPSAMPLSQSSVSIEWSTDEPSTSIVQYGTTPGLGLTSTNTDKVTSHQVTLLGLSAATTYYYRVGSVDRSNNGPTYSDIFSVVTLQAPDTAPPVITSAPSVVSIGDNSARIEWSTDEQGTSLVQYGTSATTLTMSASITSTRQMVHGVTLTGLTASTTYYYRVGSVDASNNGPAYGAIQSFRTIAAPDTKAPVIVSAPTVVEKTNTSAVIQWATDEASNSVVQYGTTTAYGDTRSKSAAEILHSVTLTGLTGSTEYNFRVGSTDPAGNGPTYSVNSTFTTEATPDTAAPVIIQAPMVVEQTDTTATIVWTTDELSSSIVEFGTTTSYGRSQTRPGDTTVHSVMLTGLTGSTSYYFRVGSRDSTGNGPAYSNAFSFTTAATPDTTAPQITSAPTVVSLTDSQATIVWSTDELSNSEVEYGTTTAYGVTRTTPNNLTVHSVTLTGLSASTGYNFRVRSVDTSGNRSDYSPNSGFTTKAAPDTRAPIVVSAPTVSNLTDSSAVIVWLTDEPSNSVVRYGTSSSSLTRSQEMAENTVAHIVTLVGLTPSTWYYYRVASTDASGNGPTTFPSYYSLSFRTVAAPDTAPPLITSAPTVAQKTDRTAVIVWSTDEPSTSRVDYGTSTSYSGVPRSLSEMATFHVVTLTGLTASTNYHFRVGSRDAAGNLTQSGDLSFKTDPAPDTVAPRITGAVTVDNLTDATATIVWTTDEPSNSIVQYGTTPSYGSALMLAENSTSHKVVLTGLSSSTVYYYRVGSIDAAGNGPTFSYGRVFRTYATPDTAAPQITIAPTVARRTDTSAVIMWSTDEPSNSIVEYGTSTAYGLVKSVAESSGMHVVTLTGLAGSTTYNFRVGSVDASGNGPTYSSNVSFTTYATPDRTAPRIISAPTVAQLSDTTAEIVWTTNEPSNSTVEYGTTSSYGRTQSLAENVTWHTVTLTGLSGSTAYNFRVGSMDVAGNGPTFSGNVTFTTKATPDTTAPQITGAPTVARLTDTTAAIVWSTNEPANAIVEYGTSTAYGLVQTIGEKTTFHAVMLTGLSESTTYNFRVGSVDGAGNGPTYSGNASFKTYATPDTAPPQITSAPTVESLEDTTAVITWSTNEPSNSIVEYGTSTAYGLVESKAESAGTHRVSLSGLSASTTYSFRVASVDASGNGPSYSGNLSFKTKATPDTSAPQITSAPSASSSDTSAVISWTTDEPSNSIVEYGTTTSYGEPRSLAESVTLHMVTLTGLSASTTYNFRVGSADAAGNGPAYSVNFTFATRAAPDTTPPEITSSPTVESRTDTTAVIVWTTNEQSNSIVQYGTTTAYGLVQTKDGDAPVTEHRVTLSGLAGSTRYYFAVGSMDAAGNGPVYTGGLSFLTNATPDTAAPRITSAPTAGRTTDTSAVIVWSTNEPSNSSVRYGTTSDNLDVVVSSADNVAAHVVTLTGLAASTKYYYQAQSRDAAGNTSADAPEPAYFTTDAAPDTAPPRITGVATVESKADTSAVITWTTDEPSNSIVEYGVTTSYGLAQTISGNQESGNSTSHKVTLTGLSASTTYNFRVGSVDAAGNGPSWSGNDTFKTEATPDTAAPVITSAPAVTGQTMDSAAITWTTDEPSNSIVEYWVEASNVFTATRGVNSALHSVTLTGLASSTTYNFRVGSRDAKGNGPTFSESSSFKTYDKPDTTAPRISEQPGARSVGSTTAEIVWKTSEPGNSIVDYGTTTTFTSTQTIAESVGLHSVSLTGLTPNTRYYYRVATVDAQGNRSRFSSTSNFTTQATADTTPPEITGGPLVESTTHNSAVISWTTDEPSNSIVSYGLASGTSYTEEQPIAGKLTWHTVTLTGLAEQTSYRLVVSSKDAAGNTSSSSREVTFTTKDKPDRTAPRIVGGPLIISASTDRAEVAWDTDEPGISVVEYAPVAASAEVTSTSAIESVTAHKMTLTDLLPATNYTYRVGSVDAQGNGPGWSANKTFTTDGTADTTAPSIIDTVKREYGSDRKMTITWKTDEPSDSLLIYSIRGESRPRTVFDGAYTTDHRLEVRGLTRKTKYSFVAESRDPSGNVVRYGDLATVMPSDFETVSTASLNRAAADTELVLETSEDPDTTAPVIEGGPTGLYKTDTTAMVWWMTNEASDSQIEYGLAQGSSQVRPALVFAGILGTEGDLTYRKEHLVTITNLTPGASYAFRVYSTDPSGNGPTYSSQTTFTTGTSGDSIAPQILTGPVVTVGDTTATIEWTSTEPADSVVLFKTGTSGTSSATLVGPSAVYSGGYQVVNRAEQTTNHSIVLTNLSPSTTYQYQVASTDPSGNGPTTKGDFWFTTRATVPLPVRIIFPLVFHGFSPGVAGMGWGD